TNRSKIWQAANDLLQCLPAPRTVVARIGPLPAEDEVRGRVQPNVGWGTRPPISPRRDQPGLNRSHVPRVGGRFDDPTHDGVVLATRQPLPKRASVYARCGRGRSLRGPKIIPSESNSLVSERPRPR